MKRTLLDLIQEFAALNAAKTLAGGRLAAEGEKRWAELMKFYEFLMAQDGLCAQPASRFTAAEIRETVTTRNRLRVRTEMEIVVDRESNIHRAKLGNLSCGGVLLLWDEDCDVGAELTLHLANVSRGQSILPTTGQVRWRSDSGAADGSFRYRMGIEFNEVGPAEEKSIDAFVVDSLENKLLSLSRDALDPEFLRRERITL